MKQIIKILLFSFFLGLLYYEYTLIKELKLVYKGIENEKMKVMEEINLKYKEREKNFYIKG